MSNWITRAETGADTAAVDAVNFHAFGRRFEADLVNRLRAEATSWLSYVAVANDEVVAHALLSRCHVDDTPVLVLGPCAVLPSYQRTGAGTAAINAALDGARAVGEYAVVVLGHAEYYPRFGFRQATEFGIHSEHDGPYQMALSLDSTRPLPRGTIKYPAGWQV